MRIEPLHSDYRVKYGTTNTNHKRVSATLYTPKAAEISFRGIWGGLKEFIVGWKNHGWDIVNYWHDTNTTRTPLGDGGTPPYDPNPVPDYSSKLTKEDIQRNVEEAIAALHARQKAHKERMEKLIRESNASINAELYMISSQPGLVSEINESFVELYNHFVEHRKKAGIPYSAVEYTYSFGPAKKTFTKHYRSESQFLIDKVLEPYHKYMYGFQIINDGAFIPFASKGDDGQKDRVFADVFPYGIVPDKTAPGAYFAEFKKEKQNDFEKIRNLCVVIKPSEKITDDTKLDFGPRLLTDCSYYKQNPDKPKEKFDPQEKYNDIRRAFRDRKWGYLISDKIIMSHIHIENFDRLFKGENCLNLNQQKKLLKLFKDSKKRGVVVSTTVSDLRAVPKMFRTKSALGMVVVDKPLYGLEKLAVRYGMHTFDNPTKESLLNDNDFYERRNLHDEFLNAIEETFGSAGKEIETWAAKQEKIAREHNQLVKAWDFAHNSDLLQAR